MKPWAHPDPSVQKVRYLAFWFDVMAVLFTASLLVLALVRRDWRMALVFAALCLLSGHALRRDLRTWRLFRGDGHGTR